MCTWKTASLLIAVALVVPACADPAGADPMDEAETDGAEEGEEDEEDEDSLGQECEDDDDCDDGICLYDSEDPGLGLCSVRCDVDEECPENYECVEVQNAAGRYCAPQADYEEACVETCQDFDVVECLADGKLSDCIDACRDVSTDDQRDFVECSEDLTFECDQLGCLDDLDPEGSPWGDESSDCMRTPEADEFLCAAMGLPPAAYTCFDGDPPTGCEAAGGFDYCCPS